MHGKKILVDHILALVLKWEKSVLLLSAFPYSGIILWIGALNILHIGPLNDDSFKTSCLAKHLYAGTGQIQMFNESYVNSVVRWFPHLNFHI